MCACALLWRAIVACRANSFPNAAGDPHNGCFGLCVLSGSFGQGEREVQANRRPLLQNRSVQQPRHSLVLQWCTHTPNLIRVYNVYLWGENLLTMRSHYTHAPHPVNELGNNLSRGSMLQPFPWFYSI